MTNVLIVSYYFPPSGGPGVQRVLKFVRYLPRHGYRPLVLTVPEDASFPVRDPSLAAEIPPEAEVFRSPIREYYGVYRKATGAQGAVNLGTAARPAASGRERVLQALRAAFFIPDGRMGWVSGGTREGLRICREHGAAAVFASGPPFTAHWIGRRIAETAGLPLVLDFRDPWIGAPFHPRRPFWARVLDERLERSCLRRAAAVITVNRDIRDDLLARNPWLAPERVTIIPNGFDPADFEGRVRGGSGDWTLAHAGTLPTSGLPRTLVQGLASLIEREPALAGRMRLRLAGVSGPGRIPFPRELDNVVRFEGYLPHRDSVQLLLDSDLLLLFVEDSPRARGILTGKLFEYLGSGRPVLAFAPEGEAAELIRRTGAGRVVASEDAEAVRAALEEALAAWRAGRRAFGEPDARAIAEYTRPAQAARLAAIIDRAVAGPPRS